LYISRIIDRAFDHDKLYGLCITLAYVGKAIMKARLLALFGIVLACVSLAGCAGYSAVTGSAPGPAPTVAVTVGPNATIVPTDTPIATIAVTPTPSPSLSVPESSPGTSVVPDTSAMNDRTYTWTYKNVQWNFNVQISTAIEDYYRDSPHDLQDYAAYALTDQDKEFLQDITGKFKANGDSYGYTDYDNAMNALTFVQSIPYAENSTDPAYTKYPIETLYDDQGDCKDKAILAAAVLYEMGYDVVLLQYQQHMAVGIDINATGTYFEYNGTRYYYSETTSVNWDIGEMPPALEGQTPTVVPL
jgi:hypothetical protein